MNNLYTKDSIESLNPLQFTRLRPQVYAGDCTYSTQLLVEILSNAVDEFKAERAYKKNINKDACGSKMKKKYSCIKRNWMNQF